MTNEDSFSRILSYFAALANEPFVYKDETFVPYTELVVTDSVFRSYSCPLECGACCMKCSLLWDTDVKLNSVVYDPKVINDVSVDFWVDKQKLNKSTKCKYLGSDAACGIYPLRPLPCRFELFKFIHYTTKNKAYARVALPGRGWALTRVTGEKGNVCKILPYDKLMTMSHVADLSILARWMKQFRINNDADKVMNYLLTGPHKERLVIDRRL